MSKSSVERRLTTVFAADMVTYSRLIDIDEEGTLLVLNLLLDQVIKPSIREHQGRIVKQMGDGILAEFASVLNAVQCAVEIQRAIAGGQFRPGDALVDLQDQRRPGTVSVFLSPVFEGHTAGIPPGSTCVGVAYTSRDAEIAAGKITGLSVLVTRIVDGMGIANAIVLRAQAILLPIRALVFSG